MTPSARRQWPAFVGAVERQLSFDFSRPIRAPRRRGTLEERFWRYVDLSGPIPEHRVDLGPCWVWIGARDKKGYGRIEGQREARGWRNLPAHRVSWELAHGPIPPGDGYHGTCVLHACDDPRCVNPGHLFLGSVSDNNRDKVVKARHPFGERHPCSRLTGDQIVEIRKRRERGEKLKDLARYFGVSDVLIGLIVRRKAWRHVS